MNQNCKRQCSLQILRIRSYLCQRRKRQRLPTFWIRMACCFRAENYSAYYWRELYIRTHRFCCEPTSALDPLAETAIYEQYHRLSEGKTTIFISHRLASTKFCDRIIYYENGQVKEDGTHDELMKKNGAYAKMFEIQSQYYNEKGGDFDE